MPQSKATIQMIMTQIMPHQVKTKAAFPQTIPQMIIQPHKTAPLTAQPTTTLLLLTMVRTRRKPMVQIKRKKPQVIHRLWMTQRSLVNRRQKYKTCKSRPKQNRKDQSNWKRNKRNYNSKSLMKRTKPNQKSIVSTKKSFSKNKNITKSNSKMKNF